MMYVVEENDITSERWDRNAKSFKDYTLYQTWAYQYVRSINDNVPLKKIIIKDSNGFVYLMAQVRLYRVPILNCFLGYVQQGPLLRNNDNVDSIKEAITLFRNYLLGEKVFIIRINPYIFDSDKNSIYIHLLNNCGFHILKNNQPYHTALLSLDKSEECIFNNFHRSWRRYLIKSQNANINIEYGESELHWDILTHLYEDSKKRKNFEGLNPSIFSQTQRILPVSSKIEIIIARDEYGEPLCAHATSYLSETALGILAASNEKGLRMNASHLVWWNTLIRAKLKGAVQYDLGGIDPENNPYVYNFKMKMGAFSIKSIGTFDYCLGLPFRVVRDSIDIIKKYKKIVQ